MSARYPRQSTPHPTAPPPLADEPSAVQLIVSRVETWKALVGIAVALLAAGGTAYAWGHSKADVAQLEQVRDVAAAALASTQAGTSVQLGALQATVQDMRAHQAKVDANLDALTSDVSRLQGTADLLYQQLVEIARSTGARQVPAPSRPPTRPP